MRRITEIRKKTATFVNAVFAAPAKRRDLKTVDPEVDRSRVAISAPSGRGNSPSRTGTKVDKGYRVDTVNRLKKTPNAER